MELSEVGAESNILVVVIIFFHYFWIYHLVEMAPTIAELYSSATWNESRTSPFIDPLHLGTAFRVAHFHTTHAYQKKPP